VDTLLKPENKNKLIAILTYHVVPGKTMSSAIAGKMVDVKTVEGEELTIDGTNGVMVNNARVTKADTEDVSVWFPAIIARAGSNVLVYRPPLFDRLPRSLKSVQQPDRPGERIHQLVISCRVEGCRVRRNTRLSHLRSSGGRAGSASCDPTGPGFSFQDQWRPPSRAARPALDPSCRHPPD